MTTSTENTISQIKNLKAELNSIYDTKVKMKMLIKLHSMKIIKKINSSSKQVTNTILRRQFNNLNYGKNYIPHIRYFARTKEIL